MHELLHQCRVARGVNQPLALLRCYGSPGCFDSGFQLVCIVGCHHPLDNTPSICYGVQIWQVCWPIKHSNPMVSKPGIGTFGRGVVLGRGQVLLEKTLSLVQELSVHTQ